MMLYVTIAAVLYVYFYPSILAYSLGHVNARGILFVNFVIAWTIIGWFFALVWAFDVEKEG